jgi:hypothetical protein
MEIRDRQHIQDELESLFARCPDLCGFSVRGDDKELFVSDVGISPRISPQQYGEIFQDIASTLADLLEEQPAAGEILRGRTFARTLH